MFATHKMKGWYRTRFGVRSPAFWCTRKIHDLVDNKFALKFRENGEDYKCRILKILWFRGPKMRQLSSIAAAKLPTKPLLHHWPSISKYNAAQKNWKYSFSPTNLGQNGWMDMLVVSLEGPWVGRISMPLTLNCLAKPTGLARRLQICLPIAWRSASSIRISACTLRSTDSSIRLARNK